MPLPPEIVYASRQLEDWLVDVKETCFLETHDQSYATLRAVLHELRDHLSIDRTIAFADALPPLVRGIYYEGWSSSDEASSVTDVQAFTDAVLHRLAPHLVPPRSIVSDVFAVLARRSEPFSATVLHDQLPQALKPLWPIAGQDALTHPN